MNNRRAVIDVGTNSVKLLVADLVEDTVHPVSETAAQTRLGREFYDDHRLRPDAIARTAEAVAEFADAARRAAAGHIRVLATSAARDATNRHDLLAAIRERSGLETEIISGEQEAEWAFRGVTSDPRFRNEQVLILDVGGGSTEFVLGRGRHHACRQSFPLGSVRLLEKMDPSDPPSQTDLASCRQWLNDFFGRQILPWLDESLRSRRHPETLLVSTGGTATLLARMQLEVDHYDREQIDSTVLSAQEVRRWLTRLWSLALAQRQKLPGLPPNRADVILTGVAVIDAVMHHLAFPQLHISTRGLRFGSLLDAA